VQSTDLNFQFDVSVKRFVADMTSEIDIVRSRPTSWLDINYVENTDLKRL